MPEVFKYLSEKLPLSHELRYFRGSRFSQCCIHQQLFIARYQVHFYANTYFELLPTVYGAFKISRVFFITPRTNPIS